MLEQDEKTYFDLSGALVYDPCVGDCGHVQSIILAYRFAVANNAILNLEDQTMAELMSLSAGCGYDDVSVQPRHRQTQTC